MPLIPMPCLEESLHGSSGAEALYGFLEADDLLKTANLVNLRQLEDISHVTPEEKEELMFTKPSILFESFPAEGAQINFDGDPIAVVTLQDALEALKRLEPPDRKLYINHILRVLGRNYFAALLKDAPGNTTLCRWAKPTNLPYGATLGKWNIGDRPEDMRPISFWRIPVEGHDYQISQWEGPEKVQYVRTIDQLCNEGKIKIDVSDWEAVEFVQKNKTEIVA